VDVHGLSRSIPPIEQGKLARQFRFFSWQRRRRAKEKWTHGGASVAMGFTFQNVS